MKRNAAQVLVVVLAALGLTAALAAGAGDGGGEPGTVVSERYDLSLSLPPGWHASRTRLVTKLLMPREVISVGTFGMAPGSGGNCGREPAASIRRMRPGDALVSVQEYLVTATMRRRLRSYPSQARIDGLQRSTGAYADGSGAAAGGAPLYFATIPFRDHGRVFDALVYFRGHPGAERRTEVDGILASLQFGPHPVGFGDHA